MPHIQQEPAQSLTLDLWAKVFAHLEEILEDDYLPQASQVPMYQLNLVCKQFRQTFTSHSGLVRQRVCLSRSFSDRLLPSLVAWLQKNQGSVRTVITKCNGSMVEVVLAELQSSQPSIEWMDVYGISPSLLTAFSSLNRCELRNTQGSILDLEPLGCLPKLTHLGLTGQFRKLHYVTGLTRLECASNHAVSQGIISDVREFAPTLQHLKVADCVLLGVHALGLSACTALTRLVLHNPCLMLNNAEAYIDKDLSLCLSSLGLLEQLHSMFLGSSEEAIASLSWVSTLTSLRELSLYMRSCNNNSPAEPASWLTNLTHLEIVAAASLDAKPVLSLDVGWDKLQALQILSINSFRLQLGAGPGVSGLLKLPQLRELCFYGSTVDESHSDCFAALMYNLARLRPQVSVSFRSGDLRTVFDRLC